MPCAMCESNVISHVMHVHGFWIICQMSQVNKIQIKYRYWFLDHVIHIKNHVMGQVLHVVCHACMDNVMWYTNLRLRSCHESCHWSMHAIHGLWVINHRPHFLWQTLDMSYAHDTTLVIVDEKPHKTHVTQIIIGKDIANFYSI